MKNVRWVLIFLWVVSSLLQASRHEPWRDEAQAWLVARHAGSLSELLFRPAMEASGPIYYLLLWPVTRIFEFAPGIFWFSWTGSLVAVILLSTFLPLSFLPLVLFGAYWGYEYSVIGRLYGWGCALFLAGVYFDRRGDRRAALAFLSLAVWTQLNFLFPVIAWVFSREWKRYWPVLLSGVLSVLYLKIGGPHPWDSPGLIGLVPRRLFSSLGLPFLQWPLPLETWGALGLVGGLSVLSRKEKIAMALALFPYTFLFALVYAGHASLRHAGPLNCVWLLFCAEKKKPWAIFLLLAVSLTATWTKGKQDWNEVFSDGLSAARKISELSSHPILHAESPLQGFVAAAVLDLPLAVEEKWVGEPFYSVSSTPVTCPAKDCFYLGRKPPPGTGWEKVYSATATIILDEAFDVFRRTN